MVLDRVRGQHYPAAMRFTKVSEHVRFSPEKLPKSALFSEVELPGKHAPHWESDS